MIFGGVITGDTEMFSNSSLPSNLELLKEWNYMELKNVVMETKTLDLEF